MIEGDCASELQRRQFPAALDAGWDRLGPKQNALWLLEQDIQTFEDLKNASGQIQSAVKCRGRECLRINYGPEYTAVENLERLRARGLSTKRSLALREFALGIEAIERFVRKEPLRRVSEAVFSVLALESEPVDPRLKSPLRTGGCFTVKNGREHGNRMLTL